MDFLDIVRARDEPGDDQRLVKLRAAAGAQGKGFSRRIARACDQDGKIARRAALAAAGFQNDLVDDQRGSVRILCAAVMSRIAQKRMHPLGIRTI